MQNLLAYITADNCLSTERGLIIVVAGVDHRANLRAACLLSLRQLDNFMNRADAE